MDKFDFGWFITIPGALISAGVVCLLIAIIVLIISNVRDSKEKKALAAVDNNQVSAGENNSVPAPQVPADVNNQVVAPVAAVPAAVEQAPVAPVSVPQVEVAPVENVVPQVEVMSTATDMVQVPVVPVEASVEVAPIAQAVEMPITVEAPMIDVQPVEAAPVEVVVPVTESLVQENVPVEMSVTVEAPVVDVPVAVEATPVEMPVTIDAQVVETLNVAPMVEAAPVEVIQQVEVMQAVEVAQPADVQVSTEVQPVIYGGASLGVSNLDLNQNPTHQIYGGANPLENTQSMPIMNDFNQVPATQVEVAQPMMEAVAAAPVEVVQQVETQIVSSTPVMEPIA